MSCRVEEGVTFQPFPLSKNISFAQRDILHSAHILHSERFVQNAKKCFFAGIEGINQSFTT